MSADGDSVTHRRCWSQGQCIAMRARAWSPALSVASATGFGWRAHHATSPALTARGTLQAHLLAIGNWCARGTVGETRWG